jgi:hypothetical protein
MHGKIDISKNAVSCDRGTPLAKSGPKLREGCKSGIFFTTIVILQQYSLLKYELYEIVGLYLVPILI